jgi:CheY-like chemotaxis protein
LHRASRPLRICLAEDDRPLAERIGEFLLNRNIDLRICAMAQDIGLAFRAAEADILLVDSDFAGGDGARLVRSLRADRAIRSRPINSSRAAPRQRQRQRCQHWCGRLLTEHGGTNLVRLIPPRGVLLATGSSAQRVVALPSPRTRLGRRKDIDSRRAESRRVAVRA